MLITSFGQPVFSAMDARNKILRIYAPPLNSPEEIPGMSQPAKEATFFQLRATDRGQMLVLLDGRRLLINPSYVTIAVFWYSSAPIEISEGDGGAL